MKKGVVILVILLFISIPLSTAKEVSVPELFEVEKGYASQDNKETYFYAGGKLVASQDDTIKYHYQNKLDSDAESKTLPFGQPIANKNRFIFTGKELDEELYYFNARYYDSNVGRFTSVDPIASEPPYQYVYNNPMKYTDPTGTQTGLVEVAPTDPATAAAEAYMIREGGRLLQQGLASSPKPTPGPWSWLGAAAAGVGTFLTVMLWASPLNEGEDEWLAMYDSADPYADYHYQGNYGPESDGYLEWVQEISDAADAPTSTSRKGRPPTAQVSFMIAFLPGVDSENIYPFLSTMGKRSMNAKSAYAHSAAAMTGAPVPYAMAESALNELGAQVQSSIHYGLGDAYNIDQLLQVAHDYLSSVTAHGPVGGRGIEEIPIPTLLARMPSNDDSGSWAIFIQNKNLPSAGAAAARNAQY